MTLNKEKPRADSPAIPGHLKESASANEATLPDGERGAKPTSDLDIALETAANGHRVFPVDENKRPRVRGWQSKATTDDEQIREWDRQWPGTRFGMATGHGVLVVDIDVKNGIDGRAEYERAIGEPDSTFTAITVSGGEHRFYRSEENSRNAVGLRPAVDIRSLGGFVVLYAIVPPTEDMAAMPEPLTELLSRKGASATHSDAEREAVATDRRPLGPQGITKAVSDEVDRVTFAPEGMRNHTLNGAAFNLGQLVGPHLNEDEVVEALTDAALEAGLEPDEIAATIRSGLEAGKKHPRPTTDAEVPAEAEKSLKLAAAELMEEVLGATGILRHILQAARARMVPPSAFLVTILLRVIAATPPWLDLPPTVGSRASLNLAVAAVGESGAGKSATLALPQELITDFRDQSAITRSGGSGEGLVQYYLQPHRKGVPPELVDDPRLFQVVDEIAALGATSNRSGATIMPTIRTALTGGGLGQLNADPSKSRNVPAHSYRYCLFTGVQPGLSDVLLGEADAGTPQRFVWALTSDPLMPDVTPEYPGPLVWMLPAEADKPGFINYPDHVRQEILDARRKQLRDGSDGLDGHKLLTRLKVAAAMALLHGGASITDQWWTLAGKVIESSQLVQQLCIEALREEASSRQLNQGRNDARRAEGAAQVRDEKTMKAAQTIWRTVSQHSTGAKDANQKHEPGEGCTRRCITRALRHFSDRDTLRPAALDLAEASDWITADGERWRIGESQPAGGPK